MAAERLLTVGEVLDLLQTSRTNLWRLTCSGKLPCVHVGERSIRFRQTDLMSFIDASTRRAGDGAGRQPGRRAAT
jgi:excisionase family DNA binding protein